MHTRRSATLVVSAWATVATLAVACGGGGDRRIGSAPAGGGRHMHGDTLTIALIAKSATNPVFLSARKGAETAATELSQKYGIPIFIRWLTPDQEDGAAQAERIKRAADEGADAILIAPSDSSKVTAPIRAAIAQGVEVMTFDSDAPASGRFAHVGVDDYDLGRQAMAELATLMGDKGNVGILAGNQSAPNLQSRVRGVMEEAAKHPGIHVIGTFYHVETPAAATAEVLKQNKAHPDLNGWAMVGGWPLFGTTFNLSPTRYKVVAIDALPSELAYIESGVVPVLLAQPVYQWGYVGVTNIVDKVHNKAVVMQNIAMKPVRVTKVNLKTWAQQLKDWGFTDVPAKYLQ